MTGIVHFATDHRRLSSVSSFVWFCFFYCSKDRAFDVQAVSFSNQRPSKVKGGSRGWELLGVGVGVYLRGIQPCFIVM